MPEPLHPPYGVTQPRTLVRWLDVNSQNGPLTRSTYDLIIPAFNLVYVSPTRSREIYAGIIGAYDYQVAFKFSLLDITSLIPANGGFNNYSLYISWSVSDTHGNVFVTRYRLYQGQSPVGQFPVIVFDNFPDYTNQLIPKNFRIEVWTNTPLAAYNAAEISLPTSKQFTSDYRYALDQRITPIDFVNVFTTPNLNLPFVFGSVPLPNNQGLTDNQGNIITDNQGNIIIA